MASGSTSFPQSLDNYTERPESSEIQSQDINDLQAAIESVEAEAGARDTSNTWTLHYRLRNASSVDPGHLHSTSGISGQIAVAQGGTGASTAADARTNLGAAASASPTFTGTITITNAGAGGNPAFSSNSSAQALYLNGSLYVGANNGSGLGEAGQVVVGALDQNSDLVVQSGPTSFGRLIFQDSNAGAARTVGQIFYDHSTDVMSLYTAGSENMKIDSAGATYIVTPNTAAATGLVVAAGTISEIKRDSSTRRIKKDIEALTYEEASKVLDIDPVKYAMKENGVRDAGFLAEDFEEVGLTDVLTYDEKGKVNGFKNFGRGITAYLLRVVQEQQKTINKLQEV